MMNQEINDILREIYVNHELWEDDLDYSAVNRYKIELDRLSQLSGSCFFIVDLHRFEFRNSCNRVCGSRTGGHDNGLIFMKRIVEKKE